MVTIRVLLADDHEGIRVGIRRLLETDDNIVIVGECKNGNEALHMTRKLQPDVLILDVEMPKLSGIEVARRLQTENSPVRILALSSYSDSMYVEGMLQFGVSGYLAKDDAPDHLLQAIHNIAQ